jgi:hypothetical protein
MNQQSIRSQTFPSKAKQARPVVVMGQGTVTPAVREHLAKARRSAAKPQQTPYER